MIRLGFKKKIDWVIVALIVLLIIIGVAIALYSSPKKETRQDNIDHSVSPVSAGNQIETTINTLPPTPPTNTPISQPSTLSTQSPSFSPTSQPKLSESPQPTTQYKGNLYSFSFSYPENWILQNHLLEDTNEKIILKSENLNYTLIISKDPFPSPQTTGFIQESTKQIQLTNKTAEVTHYKPNQDNENQNTTLIIHTYKGKYNYQITSYYNQSTQPDTQEIIQTILNSIKE